MKRSEIIGKLISEHGFTERTLVHMDDKQISLLGNRILGEQVVTTPAVNIPKTNKLAIDQARKNKETFLTYEGDVNESPDDEKKIPIRKKFKKKEVVKKLKENENVKSWIAGLVENRYHPLTSKGEIIELVKQRINEVETMQPMPTHKPKLGHNGIPEWLSFKSIKSTAEPTTKPVTKPADPVTRPGERPKPKNPFQPGPGKNPRPKAFSKSLSETEPPKGTTKPSPDKTKITATPKKVINTKPIKKTLAEKKIKK